MSPAEVHGYLMGPMLGEGGMGRVFEATRSWDGMRVALKVLHPRLSRDPVARRTIATEALATSALRHPNVAVVLDLDEHPDLGMFLVTELLVGRSLRSLLDAGLAVPRGVAILAEVVEGLRAAHAAGVVHGDLKPSNVMVDEDGRVKVCDFGIAQVLAPSARRGGRREAAGTPRYMAPEQFQSGAALDPRTDLYAVGVLLFELLYRRSPFARGDALDLLASKMLPPPPAPFDASGQPVALELRALLASAIDPDIRRRPRFAAEVLACLQNLASTGNAPDPPPLHGAWRSAIDDATRVLSSLGGSDFTRVLDGPSPEPPLPEVLTPPADEEPPLSARATALLSRLVGIGPGTATRNDGTRPGTVTSRFVATSHVPGTALVHVRPSPLVGRESVQAELEAIADAVVRERESRVVLLTGPSGIGKSRLAAWLCSRCEASGAMESASARFLSHAGPDARGLREMVAALFAPSSDDAEGVVTRTVEWLTRWTSPEAFDHDALAVWLRATGDQDSADPHGAASLALTALGGYAAARPLCLWFDDLPLSEDGSFELVRRIAEEHPLVPLLVVATVSDDALTDPVARRRIEALAVRCRSIALPPLDLAQRAQLLEGMLPLAPGVARRAAHHVGGLPLYILQRVEQWVEARRLVLTATGLAPAGDDDQFDQAIDEDALIEARIDAHLARTPEAGPVLSLLALLGPYSTERALRAATAAIGVDPAVLDLVLEEALCHGMLRARADEAAFAHASLRAGVLQRAQIHGDYPHWAGIVARVLTATAASERPGARVYVAVLQRDAGHPAEAFATLLAATEAMARGGDHDQAERQLAVAQRWLEGFTGAEADVRRDELDWIDARVAYFRNDLARAERLLQALAPRLRANGERAALGRTLWLAAAILFFTDRVAACERSVAAIRTELPDVTREGSTLGARLAHLESLVASMRGDVARTIALLRRSTSAAATEPWAVWAHLTDLAEIEAAQGNHDDARAHLDDARRRGGSLDVYQLRFMREVDYRQALARGERRDRRVYEESARAQGDAWLRTAARLVLAAWDATFSPATMVPTVTEALDAFARVPHDELLSYWFLDRIRAGLESAGEVALAARAASLLAARRAVAWADESSTVAPRYAT